MAMAAVARPPSIALLTRQRPRPRWVFTPLAASSSFSLSSPSSSAPLRKLVLYSKPGCCLCDGLKEKLQAALLVSAPDSLHDIDLQVCVCVRERERERESLFHCLYVYCECVGEYGGFCQIRDITSNPEWERAYQYEIPVLAKVLSDGTEVSFFFFFFVTFVLLVFILI